MLLNEREKDVLVCLVIGFCTTDLAWFLHWPIHSAVPLVCLSSLELNHPFPEFYKKQISHFKTPRNALKVTFRHILKYFKMGGSEVLMVSYWL